MSDVLRLVRDTLVDEYTMGRLEYRGTLLCFTLEDPVREAVEESGWVWRPEFKVYGETAIPSGTYPLRVTYSQRFKRRLPLIADVPDFEGIRLHSGTNTEHTRGCPLVGRQRDQGQGRLWDAAGLTDALIDLIDQVSLRGPVRIEVVNP